VDREDLAVSADLKAVLAVVPAGLEALAASVVLADPAVAPDLVAPQVPVVGLASVALGADPA